MAFTVEEVVSVMTSIIDFHERGAPVDNIKQARPLADMFQKLAKTFPGGQTFITTPVRGSYTSTLNGYSGDDPNPYKNPANNKRAAFPWKELHGGVEITLTELKQEGLSIVDSMSNGKTQTHSEQELFRLTENLEQKYYDLQEGTQRDFAKMCILDGTQDPKVFPGLTSFLTQTPTTGVTGGLDRSLNSWWRNRATLSVDTSTPANMAISRLMQNETRQLSRFAPSWKPRSFAGSSFLDAWEQEMRSKGNITMTGWSKDGALDPSVADLAPRGLGKFQYDPTLDDLGFAKFAFVIDTNAIKLRPMEDEAWKEHNPARPPEKYVIYRARTWTGGMTANQLNSSGIYSIA
ncbi:MAG: phage major capsid protein [Solirubrobacteraceae bacterium]